MPRVGLAVGDVVERYQIEAELGAGGMATVYLARHVVLGSHHAIKILNPDLVTDAELRERFVAEGRILAQLRHPNLVTVTDIVSQPGVAGLVQEHVDGPSLSEYLQKLGRPLTGDEAISLMQPVLRAVHHAHVHGVLHRDLKPSNILLGRDVDGAFRPVVLDFGIAKISDGGGVEHLRKKRTRTGARMGTPEYMSPEQIRGEPDLDARTDVFSMGTIIYELITGRSPFDADSEFDIMRRIVDGEYEAPHHVVSDLAPQLGRAIEIAIASRRDDRWPSAKHMSEALMQACAPPAQPRSKQSLAFAAPKLKPSGPGTPARADPVRRATTGPGARSSSNASASVDVCGCCGQSFHEQTRVRCGVGKAWTGVLERFAKLGVCPRCYNEYGLVRAFEREWSTGEWATYFDSHIESATTEREAERVALMLAGVPNVGERAAQRVTYLRGVDETTPIVDLFSRIDKLDSKEAMSVLVQRIATKWPDHEGTGRARMQQRLQLLRDQARASVLEQIHESFSIPELISLFDACEERGWLDIADEARGRAWALRYREDAGKCIKCGRPLGFVARTLTKTRSCPKCSVQ